MEDVHLHGPSLQHARHWHMIGLADEGKAAPGSFFFSRDDLRSALDRDRLANILVWLEHGDATKENMGEVVYSWLDEDDGLYVMIRFDESARSQALREWVQNGVYTGLSLGYQSKYDRNYNVLDKDILEVSIVNKPFHNKCRIKQIINGDSVERIEREMSRLQGKRGARALMDDMAAVLYHAMR
jgi:phage head maturation protease